MMPNFPQYHGKSTTFATAALNTLVDSDSEGIMRLINRLGYCLAAAIPVAILMGCSSGGSSSGGAVSGPPPEVSSITIDAVPTADATGLYIAYDEGLFAKQGLTVKIDPIDGGEFGMGDLQNRRCPARRGELRLVHPGPDRGHIRGAKPEESREDPPGEAHRPAHHRRHVADAAGQPGALRTAEFALQDGGGPGQGPRDDRHQLAQQHRPGAARLAVRGERTPARARSSR